MKRRWKRKRLSEKPWKPGGKVLVPVFAVGERNCCFTCWPAPLNARHCLCFPIYLDSPMAIEATRIYGRHLEIFDEEALAMQQSGDLRKNLETVKSPTGKDSQALNDVRADDDHGRGRHVHRRS